jgi:hypothetical protein
VQPQFNTDTCDIPTTVLATYASNIAFIDSFQPSPISRFASFRHKQILIIGSGQSAIALVQSALHSGVKQINFIATSEYTDISVSQANTIIRSDPEQNIQHIAAPRWDNEAEVANTLRGYDAVLHISDQPMLARAALLNRLCVAYKKALIQALTVDKHIWIGPLVDPQATGCWECAWRRLQANMGHNLARLQHYAFRDNAQVFTSPPSSMTSATMTARRLIFELFKHVTQAGTSEITGGLIAIQLALLES